MKFICPLIAVNDITVSKNFYESILKQKVISDFGENVTFDGGFSIQSNYKNLIEKNENDILKKSNNFELYFEEDNLDDFVCNIKNNVIEYVHELKEQPWGQRVVRFYDPDKHIIEVGESMIAVIKRFLNQGMSIEETSKRTMYPIEFVRKCLN